MRILFIFIGLLGLLLIALGIFEYRAATVNGSTIGILEQMIMDENQDIAKYKTHNKNAQGGFDIEWPNDNSAEIKNGSCAVIFIGASLFIIGIAKILQ
jgi:hypothetical protein